MCQGGKVETPAMAAGAAVHLELEREAERQLPVQRVPIKVDTREARFASRLCEMIVRLEALSNGTPVREFYVFGKLANVVITGYIDEVRPTAEGLVICDTKGRLAGSIPVPSQRISAYHQVLVYHKLLEQMLNGDSDYDEIYEIFEVDPYAAFELDVTCWDDQFKFESKNDEFDDAGVVSYTTACIKDVERELRTKLRILALYLSNTMEVNYVKSSGRNAGSAIGTCRYQYHEDAVQSLTEFSMGFWKGSREAIGVDPAEASKCQRCPMAAQCEWRALMEAAMNT
jgi:hypothetical protein